MGAPRGQSPSAQTSLGPGVTPSRWLIEWLLPALVLLPTILLPLTRDQGVFAYGGRVILDGGLPYRDFIDQKGPATHYTFALAIALFGETAVAIRFFFYLVMLVGTQLAAAIAGRLGGTEARLPAALAYAFVCFHGPTDVAWMTAQVEDILLPLFLVVVLLLGSERAAESRPRLFWAGVLLGLCCLYKPTALLTVGGIAAVVGWRIVKQSPFRWRDALGGLTWAGIGFALPPSLVFVYLALQPGFLPRFGEVMEFNAYYSGLKDGSLQQALEIFGDRWLKMLPLIVLALLGPWDRDTPVWRLFWAVLGTSAAALIVQWKFPIIYHWTPLIGCLAILAGVGIGRIIQRLRVASLAAAGLAFLLVPVSPSFVVWLWRDGLQVAIWQRSIEKFRAPFICGSGYGDGLHQAVTYVRRHTAPDDGVLVWGYEPAINFLSGRRAPSRFFVERWLTIPGVPRQGEWRIEFLDSLRARPPLYVLVVDDDNRPWYVPNPVDALRQFPEFAAFLERHYSREAEQATIAFYRRKSAGERAADRSAVRSPDPVCQPCGDRGS